MISRQNYGASNSEELKKKKESEKEIIQKILADIELMPEYKSLDKSKLSKLKKYGLPRLESWNSLIDSGLVRKEIFSQLYSYFSNYAHSEFISILQLSQTSINAKNKDNISNVQLSLGIVRIIICLAIEFYKKSFKSANAIYNALPVEKRSTINIWKALGKN